MSKAKKNDNKNNKKKIIIAVIAAAAVIAVICGLIFLPNKDKTKETVSLSVKKEDFFLSNNVIEMLSSSPERYKDTLTNLYHINKEKASAFMETPEEWLSFDITMEIQNTGNTDITIAGFDVPNNGKNNMYVGSNVGGKLSLSPGASYPISANILCENGDLSLEEGKKLADELKINILYSKTPEEFDNGTQSEEKIFSAKVQ